MASNPLFSNNYVKYSSYAFQMVVLFITLSLGGNWLDGYLGLKFPAFTLVGVFLAIFIIFYALYKLIQQNDDSDDTSA